MEISVPVKTAANDPHLFTLAVEMQKEQPMPDIITGLISALRLHAATTRALLAHEEISYPSKEKFPGSHGDAKANIMLAFRGLEDAQHRILRLQASLDPGGSVFLGK